LDGMHWEVIFVDDDSPDGTADLIRQIARDRSCLELCRLRFLYLETMEPLTQVCRMREHTLRLTALRDLVVGVQ
jgi:hypothetical protein